MLFSRSPSRASTALSSVACRTSDASAAATSRASAATSRASTALSSVACRASAASAAATSRASTAFTSLASELSSTARLLSSHTSVAARPTTVANAAALGTMPPLSSSIANAAWRRSLTERQKDGAEGSSLLLLENTRATLTLIRIGRKGKHALGFLSPSYSNKALAPLCHAGCIEGFWPPFRLFPF